MYNNPPKTLFIGQKLLFLPQCHSTNDIAASLIHDTTVSEGTVVITHEQTHGRGQRGNTWTTEPGKNLTFSLILKPSFLSVSQQFRLNMAISLAIHEFMFSYLPNGLAIKWPNDVYWQSAKMGGILIENILQGHAITHSIIGIGLNINQRNFSQGLRATSLALATSITLDEYDLEILLSELLVSLEKYYLKLRAGNLDIVKTSYLRNLYGYGEKRRFRAAEVTFEGIIVGTNESGQLAVQMDNKINYFSFKEIEFLFDDN